jgi:hypothetical protein
MDKGIDDIADWRMLEYWMQVELYRAIQSGTGGSWRHIGDYEHPYFTDHPKSGAKTNTKWIDLLLGEPEAASPNSVAWIELKDIGRSELTAPQNIRGLGDDFAALWTLRPKLTKEIWDEPPPHAIDRGRLKEWRKYGAGIVTKNQLISQIVLCHKSLTSQFTPELITNRWIQAFERRVKPNLPQEPIKISYSHTDKFLVFALVSELTQ